MPLLQIRTNLDPDRAAQDSLIHAASKQVAELLGKPERYVMVSLDHNPAMLFAGTNEPLAYLELKSIGLPENRTGELSNALCDLVHRELGVATDRIYIEFANAPRSLWGWDGGTF